MRLGGVLLGVALFEFQIVKPDGEVAERDTVAGGFGTRHAAGVFAEGDIAHAVDAVFDRVPMADDEVEQLLIAAFVAGVARGVVGDLGFGSLLGFGFGEVDVGALDGDEAPTAGQAALLGSEAYCLDAAAREFAVAFVPGALTLRRGKKPS